MRSLYVMDPLHKLHLGGDSTYVMMRESCDRGYPVAWCTPSDLYVLNGRARARVRAVKVTESAPFFDQGAVTNEDLGAFDVVWMRKDPPFDMTYIFATYILDLADTLVLNDPAGLKLFNEKLWAMKWPQFQPSTLLSNDKERLMAFVRDQPDGAVLKPWDGNGGRGVLVTNGQDRNLASMVEVLTHEGRDHVLAQAYISGVTRGDKRILLFDGEPVGAINRVPPSGDYRANMHVGATVHQTQLSERETEICDALAPSLRAHGMLFVGIDIIDGYLTEINVTSPTGIREVNTLQGVCLEADLIDRVERRLSDRG